jgi:release factor glutamine methyltransferase
MPPEARLHEPAASLDGGPDGLNFHRRVAAEAHEWLAPGGSVLIETSERQAAGTSGLLAQAGFQVNTARSEELDGTVVTGTAVIGAAVTAAAVTATVAGTAADGAGGDWSGATPAREGCPGSA